MRLRRGFCFFFFKILLMYFWLRGVFTGTRAAIVAVCRSPPAVVFPAELGSGACGRQSFRTWAPALELRRNICGAGAELLCGRWGRPGSGIEPMSPALAGGLYH